VKVFMLGWEFPPMVSGGLGVACYGLAKALNSQSVDVLFVLPKPLKTAGSAGQRESRVLPPVPGPGTVTNGRHGERVDGRIKEVAPASREEVQHAVEHAAAQHAAYEAADRSPPSRLGEQRLGASWEGAASPVQETEMVFIEEGQEVAEEVQSTETIKLNRVTFVPIDAWLQPYLSAPEYQRMVVEEILHQPTSGEWKTTGRWVERAKTAGAHGAVHQPPNTPHRHDGEGVKQLPSPAPLARAFKEQRPYIEEPRAKAGVVGPANTTYAGDLFLETERYARLALAVARGETFDIVHAHDWMTFEAAMAVAAEKRRPLVLQIHSTELDRAGHAANPRIMEIERQGMMVADAVIAVSYKTKTQLIEKYGIDPRKIEVVYNATDLPTGDTPAEEAKHAEAQQQHQKTVLFLGRLTQQKGPGYFLQAAKKVLSVDPTIRFVLAGKGAMESELKTLATQLGIRKNVQFAGFLKKEAAQRAYQTADVYVMPSISEPFGIAPLEALARDVPVIISKQSGVAEVLRHVLKVDFWDTDDLANKILAVLRHPPLAATLRQHGQHEVRQLSWDDSALRITELYERLTGKQVRAARPTLDEPAGSPVEAEEAAP
jgi:glycosyltransferase involved in cell wall biosynthesis